MNRHDSHAQRVLQSSYRSIYCRMRWLNTLAERGLRPVLQAAAKMRHAAQSVRDSVSNSTRNCGLSLSRSGVGGMESLEPRAMLAADLF